jgi:AcrR family transcriptional regulator
MIERKALELFAERGFPATTLAQIAEAAEVAPATLYSYFPSKDDLLFVTIDTAIESARERMLARPVEDTTVAALQGWLSEDMPRIANEGVESVRLRRKIIESDETLLARERLRLAQFEDILAEAFARDFSETSDDLRSRLMAAVAVNGLRAVVLWWYQHHEDGAGGLRDAYALDTTYVTSLLEVAEQVLEAIPRPQDHQGRHGI